MITILFDTETTGLLKPKASPLSGQPSIIEFYGLKVLEGVVDGERTFEVIGEFDELFKPPHLVSAEITRITGIDNNMLENKRSFASVYPELIEFFHGSHRMVAHNMSFDRQMLANELMRVDKQFHFPWPPSHVCTVEKTIAVEQRRLNLQKLHNHLFGTDFQGAHRAKNDVLPLYRCYKELVKREMIL